jgi:hypothetical protein
VKPFSAWAIVHGHKIVENRSRNTRHRGLLVIHASRYRSQAECDADYWNVQDRLPGVKVPLEVPDSGLVGTVEVTGCTEDSKSTWAYDGEKHWLLKNGRALEHVPCKGWLGVWTLKG